jgi:hypothetical protein
VNDRPVRTFPEIKLQEIGRIFLPPHTRPNAPDFSLDIRPLPCRELKVQKAAQYPEIFALIVSLFDQHQKSPITAALVVRDPLQSLSVNVVEKVSQMQIVELGRDI